ncbi:MAG: internalin, partial [Acidimicrobiia bacterium]|nr:internalin [Acidimicrobiia bacterium]
MIVTLATLLLFTALAIVPGAPGTTRAQAAGGDFSLDFVAAAPFTYNHATGGGAFNDRTIGKSADVVESLENGDLVCGDIVTYFTQIVVDAGAPGAQTINLNYDFGVEGTNGNRAGHIFVKGVSVNYGPVQNGAGTGGTDAGMIDDGGSAIANFSQAYDSAETPTAGTYPATAETLSTSFNVTDLEASEHVIVRIDVELACNDTGVGNVQSKTAGAAVVAPAGETGTINIGAQTVPFKNFGVVPSAPAIDIEKATNG